MTQICTNCSVGSAEQTRKAHPQSTCIQETSLKVLFAFYGGTSTARVPGTPEFPSANRSGWTVVLYVPSIRSVWCEAKQKSAATCDWAWCGILSWSLMTFFCTRRSHAVSYRQLKDATNSEKFVAAWHGFNSMAGCSMGACLPECGRAAGLQTTLDQGTVGWKACG